MLNQEYLNNGFFYLTCNSCDRLISVKELTESEYNAGPGYCPECISECSNEDPIPDVDLNKMFGDIKEE